MPLISSYVNLFSIYLLSTDVVQVIILNTVDTANHTNKNPFFPVGAGHTINKSYNILETGKCCGENTLEMKREKASTKRCHLNKDV